MSIPLFHWISPKLYLGPRIDFYNQINAKQLSYRKLGFPKRERSLHSEVTSKTQVQMTSFAKCPALIMAGYFVLYKISLPGSIGLISFKFGSFLKHFGILIAKISGSAGRQTTHDFKRLKIKTSFKKVKRK